MDTTSRARTVFDADVPDLIHGYSFGPSRVNALAVGCEGRLLVLSPPYKAHQPAFDELRHSRQRKGRP
jgi:hypothetical protein